nr:unnamed protein product [Haemonchus contortus]
MTRYKQHSANAIRASVTEEFNGDMTNVSIGIYFGIVRSSKFRSNESPTSNHRLEGEILTDESATVKPGTGSDFSEMYHDAPIMLKLQILELIKTGGEKVHSLFTANSCSESKKWIANEGYYRLDITNGNYIPIYYDPLETDFYY